MDVWHLGDMLRVPRSCEDSIAAWATSLMGTHDGAAVWLDRRTGKNRKTVSHTGTSDIKADAHLVIEALILGLIACSCHFRLCSHLHLLFLLSLPPLFCSVSLLMTCQTRSSTARKSYGEREASLEGSTYMNTPYQRVP